MLDEVSWAGSEADELVCSDADVAEACGELEDAAGTDEVACALVAAGCVEVATAGVLVVAAAALLAAAPCWTAPLALTALPLPGAAPPTPVRPFTIPPTSTWRLCLRRMRDWAPPCERSSDRGAKSGWRLASATVASASIDMVAQLLVLMVLEVYCLSIFRWFGTLNDRGKGAVDAGEVGAHRRKSRRVSGRVDEL